MDNRKGYIVKLDVRKDADIIEFIRRPDISYQTLVKYLIREEIRRREAMHGSSKGRRAAGTTD